MHLTHDYWNRASWRQNMKINSFWQALRLSWKRIMVITLIGLFLFYPLIWLNESEGTIGPVENARTNYSNPCTADNVTKAYQLMRRCIRKPPELPILTIESGSQLGDQMFSYAILFTISLLNHRTAYMNPYMSTEISKYYKPSLDTMDDNIHRSINWSVHYLETDVPIIKNLSSEAPQLKFFCQTQTWRYFDEVRPRILEEFRFQDHIQKTTQNELTIARKQFSKSGGIFVGVDVGRRGYLNASANNNSHLPSKEYYTGAMNYFKSKFLNPIFIVGSDSIGWCQENFASFEAGGVFIHYLNETSQKNEGTNLAILSKCEHLIFGVGSFGFWAGYLSLGEVVYCSDCLTNYSN